MIRDHRRREIEPESRKLAKHGALIRDAGREDNVKGREAVRSYDQQPPVAEIIGVADLAAVGPVRQRGVKKNGHEMSLSGERTRLRIDRTFSQMPAVASRRLGQ